MNIEINPNPRAGRPSGDQPTTLLEAQYDNQSLDAEARHELKPRITVIGVGGAGGNAVNNMIRANLEGVEFVVANTDAQALPLSIAERQIQLGMGLTQGLGAGARPDVGRGRRRGGADRRSSSTSSGSHMVFITAGMGGGTGTGAAPVIARAAREQGILTVGVVTKPFHFEGQHRMRMAEGRHRGADNVVDTLIIIPNQNLFRIANERTTFADAFKMADDVLYSGVRGVTDLMVMPGLINLDFADIRTVMSEMGKAMMGTGEAEGENRALDAAEKAISNPLLDDVSMKGATRRADQHHRRPRHDPVRGRRGGQPHPRRGRPRSQHHLRLDLRREPGRPDARLGRGDRHRRRGDGAAQADGHQPRRQPRRRSVRWSRPPTRTEGAAALKAEPMIAAAQPVVAEAAPAPQPAWRRHRRPSSRRVRPSPFKPPPRRGWNAPPTRSRRRRWKTPRPGRSRSRRNAADQACSSA